MTRQYHTLLAKPLEGGPWEIVFGDYSKQTVKDEERELRYANNLADKPQRQQFTIITTNEDQASIEEAVKRLNS